MSTETSPPDAADEAAPSNELGGETPLTPESAQAEPGDPPGAEAPSADVFALNDEDLHERALPIRPGDLTRLLMAQTDLDEENRDLFAQLCPKLGAFFHNEFYQRLRDLKETYAPLDPDSDYVHIKDHTKGLTETLDDEFLDRFEAALERANYRPLSKDVIQAAIQAPNETGLNYVPDFALFEHLRVYARGATKIIRSSRNLRSRFRKRTVILEAFQRLIVVMKFKAGSKKLGPEARPDVVYLRMFKDVPHVDMEMHLPEQGTRVQMRKSDKLQIASPLLIGIPTALLKLATAMAISPAMAATAVFASTSAGINSFFGFQRAKHKHMSYMIRNLYYLTLANNASVLVRLIDSGEEEEYKETLLSYYFLLVHAEDNPDMGVRVKALDNKIAAFLKDVVGVDVTFEIKDALSKLYRLGLATLDKKNRVVATPLEEALPHLEALFLRSFRARSPHLDMPKLHGRGVANLPG